MTDTTSLPAALAPNRPGRAFLRKATAVASTGGLLVGFGAIAATPAFAASDSDCGVGNTVSSGDGDDIQTLLDDPLVPIVCLEGTFVLDTTLEVDRDVTLYGRTSAVLDGNDAVQILRQFDAAVDVTFQNLTVRNGDAFEGGAVRADSVTVISSVFTNNAATFGGAISAEDVTVSDSTFSNNSADFEGGAIIGYGSVSITESTFVDNSAGYYGGAVRAYTSTVNNSTFVGNFAGNEGGALFTGDSTVQFSTFLNNTVKPNLIPDSADGTPSDAALPELPGESIYLAVSDGEVLDIRGNIFAGDGVSAQLGVGITQPEPEPAPGVITDRGGNVFSTTALTEANFAAPDASTQFGKTPTQIFGAGAAPGDNGGSTQTVALIAGSPAIDAVPPILEISAEAALVPAAIGDVVLDQRGVDRTEFADAGAFEFGAAAPELVATGADSGTTGWLAAIAALLLGSGAAIAVGARRRSRSVR